MLDSSFRYNSNLETDLGIKRDCCYPIIIGCSKHITYYNIITEVTK